MLYRKQVERADGLLRWSDYTELGQLDGALARHAEEVFTNLSSDARQAFDFVMRRIAPVELDEKASGRIALYRDLVSSPELESRLRGGAREFVDSMVREGLFSSETDFRRQIFVSVAHPALFRKWPRFREWLIEDQEFLRMRDRVEGCLKLWLKRGRQTHDLLVPVSASPTEKLIEPFSFVSLEGPDRVHSEKPRGAETRPPNRVFALAADHRRLGFVGCSRRNSVVQSRKPASEHAGVWQSGTEALRNCEDRPRRKSSRA